MIKSGWLNSSVLWFKSGISNIAWAPVLIIGLGLLNQALNYLIQIYCANKLEKVAFAQWTTINAWINIAAIPTTFIPLVMAKHKSLTMAQSQRLKTQSLILLLISSLVLTIGADAHIHMSSGLSSTTVLAWLSLAAYFGYTFYMGLLLHKGNYHVISILSSIYFLFRFLCILVLEHLSLLNLSHALGSLALANLLLCVIFLKIYQRSIDRATTPKSTSLFSLLVQKGTWLDFRSFFSSGAYWTFLTLASNIDVILVDRLFGASVSAHYAKASLLAKISFFIPSILAPYLTRESTHNSQNSSSLHREFIRVSLFLLIVVGAYNVLMIVGGQWIIPIFYPLQSLDILRADFLAASVFMSLLALVAGLLILSDAWGWYRPIQIFATMSPMLAWLMVAWKKPIDPLTLNLWLALSILIPFLTSTVLFRFKDNTNIERHKGEHPELPQETVQPSQHAHAKMRDDLI